MAPSSRRSFHKLAAVSLGCVAGLAAVWAYAAASRSLSRARYERQRENVHALVREHAREVSPGESTTDSSASATDASPQPPPSIDARTPEERRWYLPPDLAAALFQRDTTLETYDPWSYFRHKPGKNLRVSWAEHPSGGWSWVTNSLGLREDRELATTPTVPRVIVTGDSHTDGFCDNAEAFPHVAEAELAKKDAGRRIEIVNAGNGGFSFYNYLGELARFVAYSPDAFVVAVFAGNDFVEGILPHAYFMERPVIADTREQIEEISRARAISEPATVQGFHQLIYFRQHPEAVEQSLRAALSVVSEMRSIADAHGMRLLVLLIPAPHEMPWGENAPLFERFVRELALSKEDLAATDRVSDTFLALVREQGTETLDAREIFGKDAGPWYWTRDHHMNVRAHAAIGRALARTIEAWGGKFAR